MPEASRTSGARAERGGSRRPTRRRARGTARSTIRRGRGVRRGGTTRSARPRSSRSPAVASRFANGRRIRTRRGRPGESCSGSGSARPAATGDPRHPTRGRATSARAPCASRWTPGRRSHACAPPRGASSPTGRLMPSCSLASPRSDPEAAGFDLGSILTPPRTGDARLLTERGPPPPDPDRTRWPISRQCDTPQAWPNRTTLRGTPTAPISCRPRSNTSSNGWRPTSGSAGRPCSSDAPTPRSALIEAGAFGKYTVELVFQAPELRAVAS